MANIKQLKSVLAGFDSLDRQLLATDTLAELLPSFSSLALERLRIYLRRQFPGADFSRINESTTVAQLLSCLEAVPNDTTAPNSFSTPPSRPHPLPSHTSIPLGDSTFAIGIDVDTRASLPKDLLTLSCDFRDSIFHPSEILYSLSRPDPTMTLLGLYCAKEAAKKTSAELLATDYSDIIITHSPTGRPKIPDMGACTFYCSISHSFDVAVAVVIRFSTND